MKVWWHATKKPRGITKIMEASRVELQSGGRYFGHMLHEKPGIVFSQGYSKLRHTDVASYNVYTQIDVDDIPVIIQGIVSLWKLSPEIAEQIRAKLSETPEVLMELLCLQMGYEKKLDKGV